MPARRYATTWEKPTLRIAAAQFDSWSHFPKAIIRHQFRLRRSPCGSLRQHLRPYHNMKTQPSFKELATAFVAAGSPGASDRERPEAEQLATGLPLRYLTEAKALKVLVRDLDTGTVIGLIRRWSERPETAVRPAAILSWTGYRFARSYHLCVRWLPGSLGMEG
jgi:hypothetical protein